MACLVFDAHGLQRFGIRGCSHSTCAGKMSDSPTALLRTSLVWSWAYGARMWRPYTILTDISFALATRLTLTPVLLWFALTRLTLTPVLLWFGRFPCACVVYLFSGPFSLLHYYFCLFTLFKVLSYLQHCFEWDDFFSYFISVAFIQKFWHQSLVVDPRYKFVSK